MTNVKLDEGQIQGDSVASILDSALDASGGLLRLTPTWVPRYFLHPGRRIKLHPGDHDRFAADQGGIDERSFRSTTVDGQQLFSAKELTVTPGAKCTLQDPGASSRITVQARGRMGTLDLQTPAMIRFGENTSDEVFISSVAATAGIEIENLETEPLVGLRYFGPNTHDNLPKAGS